MVGRDPTLSAVKVDDSIVVRRLPGADLAESRFSDQIEFGEERQRPIHARRVDPRIAPVHCTDDLCCAEVTVTVVQYVPDQLTLASDAVVTTPEHRFKRHKCTLDRW